MIMVTVILVGVMGIFSTDGMYQSKKVISSELNDNNETIQESMDSIKNIIQFRFTTFRINKDLNENYTLNDYDEIKKTVEQSYNDAKEPL